MTGLKAGIDNLIVLRAISGVEDIFTIPSLLPFFPVNIRNAGNKTSRSLLTISCVCVVRERECEYENGCLCVMRESLCVRVCKCMSVCACACVCVRERGRERAKEQWLCSCMSE